MTQQNERRNYDNQLLSAIESLKKEIATHEVEGIKNLNEVNKQMALLVSSTNSERGNITRAFDDIKEHMTGLKEDLNELNKKINDSDDGVMYRLKRLEEIEKNRSWQLKIFWAAVCGVIVKYGFEIWQAITKKLYL